MGGLPFLDLAIGLSFVYLLLALVCTTLMEWIAQWKNLRGNMLEEGTRRIFGEGEEQSPITHAYFNHPLVVALRDNERKPSYVPGPVFARALKGVLTSQGEAAVAARASDQLTTSLKTLKESEETTTLGPDDVERFPSDEALAEWYDQAMERISGTYKRKTRWIILGLAFLVTIVLNANTLTVASNLWRSPTLRAYVLERAKVRLDQGAPLETVEYTDPTNPIPTAPVADSSKSPNRLLDEEQSLLGQLFGWTNETRAIQDLKGRWGNLAPLVWLLVSLIGWTITALAVSLGAPFWFDTLNRFMQLRSSGSPPPTTQRPPPAAQQALEPKR
jgi:hypothetical protein